MLTLIIGPVNLDPVPPRDAVTVEGGGRPVTEKVALDGTLLPLRPGRATSRRLTITAPQGFALLAEQTAALEALAKSGERFTVTVLGYVASGVFEGCLFADRPQFPPTRHPAWRGFQIQIYLPQE